MARRLRVHRKGYYRGPYVMYRRGRPVRVRRHYVPPTSFHIRDVGKPGRGKPVIKIKPGLLSKHGYSTKLPEAERREALDRAVREYGAARVWRMLHAQVILRKRTQPETREKFVRDRNYIRDRYGGPVPREAIRAWVRMSPRERVRRMPGGER
jgi:hypothetical protein